MSSDEFRFFKDERGCKIKLKANTEVKYILAVEKG